MTSVTLPVASPRHPLTLTEDELFDRYTFRKNPLVASAAFDDCLFETFGAELAAVRAADPACVWTFGTDDDGLLCLFSGYHVVNRLGYLISTAPVPDELDVFVALEDDTSGLVRSTHGLACPRCDDDRDLWVQRHGTDDTIQLTGEAFDVADTDPCSCGCGWAGAVANARVPHGQ